MSGASLWIKAFHIVFVASWFSSLFYLPRLFVNLALVLGVIGYHDACRVLLRGFEQFGKRRSHQWFRVFSEASVLLFAATVVLVVVKPL